MSISRTNIPFGFRFASSAYNHASRHPFVALNAAAAEVSASTRVTRGSGQKPSHERLFGLDDTARPRKRPRMEEKVPQILTGEKNRLPELLHRPIVTTVTLNETIQHISCITRSRPYTVTNESWWMR